MPEWTSQLLKGGLICSLAILGLAVVHLLGRRGLHTVQSLNHVQEARQRHLVTLIQILRWTVNVLILVTALLMLLSTFGIDITPLLASVGVAGLALSLGAQSLIKDLLGGLLILLENQYAVGDYIQVGNVSGQVEHITLRATLLRALNGDLYVIPNGEVRILANQTRGWSRVQVDVGVAYEEDLDRALRVLEENATAFAQDPTFAPHLVELPEVLGVIGLGDSAITVRIAVKTQPGKQWLVGRELRRYILAACEREKVSLPYPRQEVWVRILGGD
jgi:small-conductance mechanosensitive channel